MRFIREFAFAYGFCAVGRRVGVDADVVVGM
jgi:hypothetical protein